MSDETMMSIQLDKYFTLLERLVPAAAGFALYDAMGQVIAEHGDTFTVSFNDYTTVELCDNAGGGQLPVHFYKAAGERVILGRDLSSSLGRKLGALLVSMSGEISRKGCNAIHHLAGCVDAVASCLVAEYELTAELDAMAQELTGRYEELNLVYRSNNDSVSPANEADTVNIMLHSYVEYLDVGMVALIFPGQEAIHYAVSEINPIKEPHQLLRKLASALFSRMDGSQACIIINEVEDIQRKGLGLDIPYKALICPVLDNQGLEIARLICMNHLSKPDFYNSDKNLLDVMSRKISKIILSNHDVLTGLLNQHAFKIIMQDAIDSAGRKGVSHAYLNIDLDQLSVVNDTFGREEGDKVIKAVSEQLKSSLRTTDNICYLSEGRFGVVLQTCDLDQGVKVAGNLAQAVVKTPWICNHESVELTVCIGIASIGQDVMSTDAIFEAGELARNAAKKAGRNQIRVYRDGSTEMAELKEQMQWVHRIQKALRNNLFRIYCQDITSTGIAQEKYHFEVLVRMIGENGEIITPNMFIPTAERYNLMPVLDRWVIDSTFAQLHTRGLALQSREGLVSINLSGQSLVDEGLADYIIEMLCKYQLRPDCICFEITETSAFGNLHSAKIVIDRLKAIGCYFSLDDFGTGLSSFSYLKELPVDYLKIDGSFVRVILEDNIAHAMVSSINQIGHVMHLKTIAEYVESEEIASQLRLIGVDYLQGYNIGKPLPLEEYIANHGLAALSRTG